MIIPEALTVARMTDRELHAAGYPWCDRTRADALDVLATEVERLQAHIASVSPLLAIHGMGGYTMGEFVPTDPASPLGVATVQFGPVPPPAPRCPFAVSWTRLVAEVDAKAGTE